MEPGDVRFGHVDADSAVKFHQLLSHLNGVRILHTHTHTKEKIMKSIIDLKFCQLIANIIDLRNAGGDLMVERV